MSDHTLIDVLGNSVATPGGFLFLADGEKQRESMQFAELYRRAIAIAAELQARGLQNERAFLLYQPGLEFIEAFFGCLCAGVIAVPAYPPRPNRANSRIQSMLRDADPKAVLISQTVQAGLRGAALASLSGLDPIVTTEIQGKAAGNWKRPAARPESIAFLQYTSGS